MRQFISNLLILLRIVCLLCAIVCFILGGIAAINGDYAKGAYFIALSIAVKPEGVNQ